MATKVKVHWFSKKGNQTSRNNDAGAAFLNGKFLFSIISDATERGRYGGEYVKSWIEDISNQMRNATDIDVEKIISWMKSAFERVRFHFPLETACYAGLLLDLTEEKAWVLSCGDCRVGFVDEENVLLWITEVHSLANWKGEEFTLEHAQSPNRFKVTKTLNSKRFEQPSSIEVPYKKNGIWILATDGYWIESQMLNGDLKSLEDDASYLTISTKDGGFSSNSDSDNWQGNL